MSSRDRSIIAVIVLLIVAVGGYFLVVQPERHTADQLQTQINTQRTDLSTAEAQVQTGLAAEAEYKTYASQLKSIDAAVPSDDQIPELINELQAASTRNRIGFEMVSTAGAAAATASATTETTATSFPSESFDLSFSGGYFAVSDLLGTLDNFVRADDRRFTATGRLLSISTVDLSPGGSGGAPSDGTGATASAGSGQVTATITAQDYDIPTALLGTGASSNGG